MIATRPLFFKAICLLAILGSTSLLAIRAGADGDRPNQPKGSDTSPAVRPADNAVTSESAAAHEKTVAVTTRDIHAALQAPFKPSVERSTELTLDHWLMQFKVDNRIPLIVDEQSFQKGEFPVFVCTDESPRIKIQKMPGATVEQVLRAVLAQITSDEPDQPDRIAIRVRDGAVRLVRTQDKLPGRSDDGAFITLHIEDRPLVDVLSDLNWRTGANIILDLRQKEKARTAVSASISDVRLMAALRAICDMCDLQPVAMNNIFYVTSKQNAAKIQKENGERRSAEPALTGVRPPVPLNKNKVKK